MANTVRLRRSSVQGAVPTTAQLALGELAINTYDGKAFLKRQQGAVEAIIEIGASSSGFGAADWGTVVEGVTNAVVYEYGSLV